MARRDDPHRGGGGGGAGDDQMMGPVGGGGAGGSGGGGGSGRGNPPASPLEELMRRKGVEEAWSALEEMQQHGIATDRFTVSRMLMKTVGDARNRMNPSKVYRGIALVERFIQTQPEEADEVLFNALLDTCCRIKDLVRLENTVHRMKELQIYPSHVTLGILVKAYGQAGDISRVLKVWDEMAEQRRQANAVTYGCMIDACVKCGHMDKAIEIFQDMKKRRKHRNTILYTTLIKGYGLDRNIDKALALFREMKDEGVPYNTITYNSIIDVCIKCSDVQTAEELLREMMGDGNSPAPDLITYSTLLKGYCHVGDLDKALHVAETIKASGLKCDELVYNTLMDGCVKANDLSAGIGLFAEMTQAGMKPSSITHSILVRLYQRNGYKGDFFDAVAQLYQHHGLERPNGVVERGGKGNGRHTRSRNHNNNNHNSGGHNSGGGGGGRYSREGRGNARGEYSGAAGGSRGGPEPHTGGGGAVAAAVAHTALEGGWDSGAARVQHHLQQPPQLPHHHMRPPPPPLLGTTAAPYGGAFAQHGHQPIVGQDPGIVPYRRESDMEPLLSVPPPSALGNPYLPMEAIRGHMPMQPVAMLGSTGPDLAHPMHQRARASNVLPIGRGQVPPPALQAPWMFPAGPTADSDMDGLMGSLGSHAQRGSASPSHQDPYSLSLHGLQPAPGGPPGNNGLPVHNPFDMMRLPRPGGGDDGQDSSPLARGPPDLAAPLLPPHLHHQWGPAGIVDEFAYGAETAPTADPQMAHLQTNAGMASDAPPLVGAVGGGPLSDGC